MNEDDPTINRPATNDVAGSRPIEAHLFTWPEVSPDPVMKMRALASALPHCAVREIIFDAPFDRVWDFISDLENNTPRFEKTVARLEILNRSGDSLRIRARMSIGLRTDFDVILRPGWCLMDSRFGQIGMAARPEGNLKTRFIHFEGSALFGRILRPYFHWNIGGDFRRLNRLLT